MKNKMVQLLSMVLLLLFPFSLSAQVSNTGGDSDFSTVPSIGVKAGANLSNVYDAQGDDFRADAKLGLAVGAFLTLPITKYFGVQPEILFSQKGYQGSGSILGSEYSYIRSTNYIDVPIFVAIRTSQYLTILFGPQYSFLLSENYTFESDFVDVTQNEQTGNENLLRNTLCLAGGLDININRIVLSGRAGWDILKNEGDGTSTTPRYKNMWYQATIGYRF
jgi:hypothetical protein